MIAKEFRHRISESILFPIGKKLSFLNPDHVTLLTYPLAVFAAYLIYTKDYPLALVFVVLSTLADNLDGAIAKANNRRTKFGSYLDAFTDKIQEFLILAGFALSGYALEAFFATSMGLLVSYAKARAEMVKSLDNIDWPSIGERAERLLVIMIVILVAIAYPVIEGMDAIRLGLYVLIAMGIIGTLQRFFFAHAYLK